MKWLRVTLRELLLLTMIVAIALVWWADRLHHSKQVSKFLTIYEDCIARRFDAANAIEVARNVLRKHDLLQEYEDALAIREKERQEAKDNIRRWTANAK